ncbi:MAG TPA: cytochrome c peroxidase [Steroidobacteraceae bacterium]|nr:cytochrome c peroxidase [Steroidobacteraceae bacterium]
MALAATLSPAPRAVATDADFELSARCPPSFELTARGACEFRDRYQFYDSLQGRGVGGTRTSLPPHRDGFTPAEIDLGRYLFFDPILSGDHTMSCASCHRPDKGLADGRPRSIGIAGRDAGRAAPTLWNVAFLERLFWDARAESLEAQATGPLFSPVEMGNEPGRLLASLNGNATYRRLFRQAFPARTGAIDVDQVGRALAAFESTLVSFNSRYDRYAHGYATALDEREIEGLNVFRSFVARCSECHTPPLFTNGEVAVIGAPEPRGRAFDVGAEKTFDAPKLRGGFKVPTLRNVARTAPYMHSGVFGTLRETVEFYNKGRGNAVPEDQALYLHWHISSPNLTEREVERLVDFLQTLTDETFLPQVPARVPSGLPPLDNPVRAAAAPRNPHTRGVDR